MLTEIDAPAFRRWLDLLGSTLDRHQEEINALNVFPIPDGDTGTNMALTVAAGVSSAELLPEDADVNALADGFSTAVMAGARGNSGVILAAYLRAFVTRVAGGAVEDLVDALRAAADAAYAAVGDPIEGTILTIANAAATAAELAIERDPEVALDELVLAVVSSSAEALENTPAQLAALARAGVVDAGGRGLVVVLESLAELVTGSRHDVVPTVLATPVIDTCLPTDGAFEVMYQLTADQDPIDQLRRDLLAQGSSVVIAGTQDLWSIHVHTDDVGAVIEAGLGAGRPVNIRVTDLRSARGGAADNRPSPRPPTDLGGRDSAPVSGRGIVAVAHGPGMRELLETSGVEVVMAHGRVAPAADELRAAIERTGVSEVVVLPSSSGIRAAAELAAEMVRDHGVTVAVIPTRSIVQTLAAVAVHDPEVRFADDVVCMTRAATATHYGGVSVSTREAMTSAGRCSVGDVLGIIEGDVVEIGHSLSDVTYRLLHRMLSVGGELVTVVHGDGSPADLEGEVLNRLRREHPGIEFVSYDGGQPLWPLILGVE